MILLILQLETDYFFSSFISEMLLKAEAFYSLPRLPKTSFYSKNLQNSSDSTIPGIPQPEG